MSHSQMSFSQSSSSQSNSNDFKICSKCKISKSISEFYKSKYNTPRYICKSCHKESKKNKPFDVDSFLRKKYYDLIYRLKNRDLKETFTVDEFLSYCKYNKKFITLFINWKKSNFDVSLTPSILRKKYEYLQNLNSIEFIENKNNRKGRLSIIRFRFKLIDARKIENDVLELDNIKRCSHCNDIKELNEFYDRSNKCMSCHSDIGKSKRRTKEGLIKGIFKSQKRRSLARGHELPSYTLDELFCWFNKQDNFELLYTSWVDSEYDVMLIPSVDRLDDRLGYSFDNIRLVTWAENDRKNKDDMLSMSQIDYLKSKANYRKY